MTRLQEQLQALRANDQAENIQIAKDYEAFLRGPCSDAKP